MLTWTDLSAIIQIELFDTRIGIECFDFHVYELALNVELDQGPTYNIGTAKINSEGILD